MESHSLTVTDANHQLEIPYFVIGDQSQGPHIFLSGGIHGDEINGIALVKRFIDWAQQQNLAQKIKGKITILPVLNPPGFNAGQRYLDNQQTDLNRQFGIAQPTSWGQIIAQQLTEKIFANCQLGIDCHDAGGSAVLLPHVRVHKSEELNCQSCSREVGQIFGTKILLERKGHPNMMAVALKHHHNIPVITVEIGGAQRLYPTFLNQGLQGIINVLIHLGMITGEIKQPAEQFVLLDRFGFTAPFSGILECQQKLGETVHSGQLFGTLYNPVSNEVLNIEVPACGIVFSLWERGYIEQNQILFSILEKEQCHSAKHTATDKVRKLAKAHIIH